ncbi:hypothetical protein FEP48_04196 [Burkholderia multivorans]|nr:hypothetical protein [Burkholderia multivorans]MDR9076724.1 hypothetical protein [Burkholderia multivorans]
MPSNILVVEDEPAISELISVNLQHAGHCPIRAYWSGPTYLRTRGLS